MPIALVFNGISHVVMMATPKDLEDFALGFSLSEGIVSATHQVLDIEHRSVSEGIELAITITGEAFAQLKNKRRNLTGRTGCGLCGAESLQQAKPVLEPVTSDIKISHQTLQVAINNLQQHQHLHQYLQQQTGAVHAAIGCDTEGQLVLAREDVGRHNALDKLLGAMAKQNLNANLGFILVTSRASYEMVVKAARANVGILAAVSAPTSLAITLAEQSHIGLVGFSRPHRHVVYAGQDRFTEEIKVP
jgi:FdhD protein